MVDFPKNLDLPIRSKPPNPIMMASSVPRSRIRRFFRYQARLGTKLRQFFDTILRRVMARPTLQLSFLLLFCSIIFCSVGCVERETIDWANYQIDTPKAADNGVRDKGSNPQNPVNSSHGAAGNLPMFPAGSLGSGGTPFKMPTGGLGSGASGFSFPAGGLGSGATPSFPQVSFPLGGMGSGAVPNFPVGGFGTGN